MLATILTSDSATTTTISTETTVREYFQGATFRPILTLEEELSTYCHTSINVLLEGGKYVNGEDPSTILESPADQSEFESFVTKILPKSDVVVILLTADLFETHILYNWDMISNQAKDGSIWCLGTSRKLLEQLNTFELEKKDCEVYTYERVGVAPIGTEIKKELIRAVQNKS